MCWASRQSHTPPQVGAGCRCRGSKRHVGSAANQGGTALVLLAHSYRAAWRWVKWPTLVQQPADQALLPCCCHSQRRRATWRARRTSRLSSCPPSAQMLWASAAHVRHVAAWACMMGSWRQGPTVNSRALSCVLPLLGQGLQSSACCCPTKLMLLPEQAAGCPRPGGLQARWRLTERSEGSTRRTSQHTAGRRSAGAGTL